MPPIGPHEEPDRCLDVGQQSRVQDYIETEYNVISTTYMILSVEPSASILLSGVAGLNDPHSHISPAVKHSFPNGDINFSGGLKH